MAFFLKRESGVGSTNSGKSANKPIRRITKDDISRPLPLSWGVSQSLPPSSTFLKEGMRGHKRGKSEPTFTSHGGLKSPIGGRMKPVITRILLTAIPASSRLPTSHRIDRAQSIQVTFPLNINKPLPAAPSVEPLRLKMGKGPHITITQPTLISACSTSSQYSRESLALSLVNSFLSDENLGVAQEYSATSGFGDSTYDHSNHIHEAAWDDKSLILPGTFFNNKSWITYREGPATPRRRAKSLNLIISSPTNNNEDSMQASYNGNSTLCSRSTRSSTFYFELSPGSDSPRDMEVTRASSILDPDGDFMRRFSQHFEDHGFPAMIEMINRDDVKSFTNCETLMADQEKDQDVGSGRPVPDGPVEILVEYIREGRHECEAELDAQVLRFADGECSPAFTMDDDIFVFRRHTRQMSTEEQEELMMRRRGTYIRDWFLDHGEISSTGGDSGDTSDDAILDGDFVVEPEEIVEGQECECLKQVQ